MIVNTKECWEVTVRVGGMWEVFTQRYSVGVGCFVAVFHVGVSVLYFYSSVLHVVAALLESEKTTVQYHGPR